MNFTFKNPRHFYWFAIGLIVLVALACYFNGLPNEMFWDDDDFILKNRFIKDWHYFPHFFTDNLVAGGYLVSNYWRPFLLTIFAIEWHLWQTWVYGWHAVNIAFHAGAAVMLFFLLKRLFANRVLALVVALLFVAHPVHNEAVVYVNSLGDSLAALLVFASLYLFACFRQQGAPAFFSPHYYFAILLYPLAIMSKETGFVLVGLVVLMDFLLLQANKAFWMRVKNVLLAVWPFLLIAAVYIFLRGDKRFLNFSNSFNFYNGENEFSSHITIRLMTFFKAITQYVAFLFFPYELKVERLLPWAKSIFEWDVLLGGAIVAALVWEGFKYWKSKPWLSFGIGWFFIAIAPTSNVLIPINAVIYEHFLYVPMIGITLIVVTAVMNWGRIHHHNQALIKLLGVVIVIFCATNIHRNLDWRTSIGFYEKLAVQRPDSYRVINNLGMEYANKGIHDKAEATYLKAIALDPKNPVAYHNIGGTYRDTGRIDAAIMSFQKAISLNPNFVFSYKSLAELYYRLGKLDLAEEYVQAALSITPDDIPLQQAALTIHAAVEQKNKDIHIIKKP